MHYDKNMPKSEKKVHNCDIFAQSQNPLYLHQAPIVPHQCTTFEENLCSHFWEITREGQTHAQTHFKIPLWWEPVVDDNGWQWNWKVLPHNTLHL